jgi:hypothetical protein
MKILRNGKLNIIKDLEEQFNEIFYLIPINITQEKLLQHGTKNRVDELLESARDHMFYSILISLKMKC